MLLQRYCLICPFELLYFEVPGMLIDVHLAVMTLSEPLMLLRMEVLLWPSKLSELSFHEVMLRTHFWTCWDSAAKSWWAALLFMNPLARVLLIWLPFGHWFCCPSIVCWFFSSCCARIYLTHWILRQALSSEEYRSPWRILMILIWIHVL